ncbi:DUF6265 family protein [Christiangramia sp. SM2212]|uniref:DUF6265 family protein n=1 Tax=Christiangramia sediminicola TaxID=3073267 RepID=UPI00286912C1|nr:DUF6265 family protein [Christiangramia sp. SM2212]
MAVFFLNAETSNSGISVCSQEDNFDWIIGEWVRINDKEGITTTEKWENSSDNMYSGIGLASKDGEIVFREDLRILKKNDTWIYEVTGVNSDTTNFLISSITSNSFTAINLDNPFPKEINYRAEEGRLIAEISDDENKIVFEFRKDQK